MSNKNVLTSVRNTRNSNKSNPDTEPEEPVQSRQQSQARPDMAALSQADTAAIQEALANLRKSDEQLKSQKITFEAEVQRIKESYDDSTINLGKAIKVIESFEARLVAVETQAQKIPDLEQRVNALSGEKDQLQIEKDLLAGEIDQLKTDFDQYKIRPEKFLYNRTLVCSNLYMKPEESREDMLEIADRLLKQGFKMVPPPTGY
jgi:chromosome segregation ATPase